MTIKDVATLAGVSPSTVSKVINHKDDSITAETRERVLQIVKEYNFKPYRRYIRGENSPSGFLGLVLPGSIEDFSDYISGAQSVASAEGYSLILCSFQNEREAEKQLNNLLDRSVDGVTLYLDQKVDFKSAFSGAPEKLVYVAASNRSDLSNQCAVCCTFSSAARIAAEHLIDFGHKEISLLGWRDHFLTEDLISGYNEALYEHNIHLRENAIFLCDSIRDVMNQVRQITYGTSTAFLCQDARIAACVYRVLSRYGLRIPKDYSIISVSNRSAPLNEFDPDLTMVDIHLRELGQAVTEILILEIEGRAKSSETRNLSPQLWQGASVAPPLKSTGKRIVVVGSMNMDVIIHMTHIPTSGESLHSQRILNLPGGKGANQGVGVAKLGGDAYVIGCLGGDQEGRLLFSSLVGNGVSTVGVQIIHEKPTGKAYILVAENGESTIVRAHGANSELKPAIIEANSSCFEDAQFCLISTEIPWETVLYTIDFCYEKKIKTIVKPTVQRVIPPEVLKKISYLVPNEKELEVQVEGTQSIEEKAASLYDAGAQNVIVTLGKNGCYLYNRQIKRHFPAADFHAMDTTGAGDAFVSSLAVYLSENHDIISAIRFATYAAGLSVTRDGAQPALTDRMTLEIYSDKYNIEDMSTDGDG